VLGPPCLLILEALVAKGRVVGVGGNPENDVPVVAGGCEKLPWSKTATVSYEAGSVGGKG